MCLTPIASMKTAKKDITVYKVITRTNKSQFHDFKYTPDTLYRLRRPLKPSRYGNINEGFHSYLSLGRVIQYPVYANYKLVKFIIPKGAKYVLGNGNDIVSTSIRSGDLVHINYKQQAAHMKKYGMSGDIDNTI